VKGLYVTCAAAVLLFVAMIGGMRQASAAPPVPRRKSTPAKDESACPSGTEDMLNWFTMAPDLRDDHHLEGTNNPMYTTVLPPDEDGLGQFIWTKSKKGFPWDVKLYDDRNIYIWLTESSWTDAHTYKAFANKRALPLSPRCVKLDDPDPKSTMQIADTTFEVHSSCKEYVTKNLKKAVTHLFGPKPMNFGGDLPDNLPTMIASYQYICDSGYRNCRDKEEFYLAKPYGIVEWRHYKLEGDDYTLVKTTTHNRVVKGQVKPIVPCLEK